jgi:ribose 5-phosphate isomerase B
MKIGLAADHKGYALKQNVESFLTSLGYQVIDFGPYYLDKLDDYPDFVIPLAMALHNKEVKRGIAICESGVGASIAANKIQGVRAALINDHFSAHQGVENDDMNLLCLGGTFPGFATAKELVKLFLDASFANEEKYIRRLRKISSLEYMINVEHRRAGITKGKDSLNMGRIY